MENMTADQLAEEISRRHIEVDMRDATDEQMDAFAEFLAAYGFVFPKYATVVNNSIAATFEEWVDEGFCIFVSDNKRRIGANRVSTIIDGRFRVPIRDIVGILPCSSQNVSESDFDSVF